LSWTSSTAAAVKSRAAAVNGRRAIAAHVPGEVGIWVLILGDMTVFALFFGVFVHYRSHEAAVFAHSQATLNRTYGAVNTLLLLTSSLFVVSGVEAVRRGMRNVAPKLFVGAFVCGLGFSFIKYLEYSAKARHGISLNTNDFYMYYFILTGIHFFHLLIGMGVLVALIVLTRKEKLSEKQFAFVEGGACFWHMVDLLWIVLFALLYLVHT
jgi:nitric oxide reductase NorE protein